MMTREELVELGQQMFGKLWKSRFAMEMGVNSSTVNRWINGQTPISKKNAIAIRALHAEYTLPKPKPKRQKVALTRNLASLD